MISSEARQRRRTAAEKYKPAAVDLLLVAEAPPNALERYFYFDDVTEQDSLFHGISKSIIGKVPDRKNKSGALLSLRDAGVFLIDVKEEPGRPSEANVSDLVERCQALSPRVLGPMTRTGIQTC